VFNIFKETIEKSLGSLGNVCMDNRADLLELKKLIVGNGSPGICGDVRQNKEDIAEIKTNFKTMRSGAWQLIVKFAPYIGMAILAYIAAKSNGTIT
jgi:hypothetical protein